MFVNLTHSFFLDFPFGSTHGCSILDYVIICFHGCCFNMIYDSLFGLCLDLHLSCMLSIVAFILLFIIATTFYLIVYDIMIIRSRIFLIWSCVLFRFY